MPWDVDPSPQATPGAPEVRDGNSNVGHGRESHQIKQHGVVCVVERTIADVHEPLFPSMTSSQIPNVTFGTSGFNNPQNSGSTPTPCKCKGWGYIARTCDLGALHC